MPRRARSRHLRLLAGATLLASGCPKPSTEVQGDRSSDASATPPAASRRERESTPRPEPAIEERSSSQAVRWQALRLEQLGAACGISEAGELRCLGQDTKGAPTGLVAFADSHHACALDHEGAAWCRFRASWVRADANEAQRFVALAGREQPWLLDEHGKTWHWPLRDGYLDDSPTTTLEPGPEHPPLVELVGSREATCGRTRAGAVWCWPTRRACEGPDCAALRATQLELGERAGPAIRGVGEPPTLVVLEDRVCAATPAGASCQRRTGETFDPRAGAENFDLALPGGAAGLFRSSSGDLFAVDSRGVVHGFGEAAEAKARSARRAAGDAVVELQVTDFAGCVLRTDGQGACWGSRSELGLPNLVPDLAPTRIVPTIPGRLTIVGGSTCFAQPDQTRCWVLDRERLLDIDMRSSGELRSAELLAAEQGPRCELEGARLRCGHETYDDLLVGSGGAAITRTGEHVGAGSMLLHPLRLDTELAGRLTEFHAAIHHACGLLDDARVACWGTGRFGVTLGPGWLPDDTPPRPTPSQQPVVIDAVGKVRQIAVARTFACARTIEDRVWCWGVLPEISLSDPPRETPPLAPHDVGLVGVRELGASNGHVCASHEVDDGEGLGVSCWGFNQFAELLGEMGIAVDMRSIASPRRVAGPEHVVELVVGQPNCAREADGALWCWGWGLPSKTLGPSVSRIEEPIPIPIPL